jgi:hypothetical protein
MKHLPVGVTGHFESGFLDGPIATYEELADPSMDTVAFANASDALAIVIMTKKGEKGPKPTELVTLATELSGPRGEVEVVGEIDVRKVAEAVKALKELKAQAEEVERLLKASELIKPSAQESQNDGPFWMGPLQRGSTGFYRLFENREDGFSGMIQEEHIGKLKDQPAVTLRFDEQVQLEDVVMPVTERRLAVEALGIDSYDAQLAIKIFSKIAQERAKNKNTPTPFFQHCE